MFSYLDNSSIINVVYSDNEFTKSAYWLSLPFGKNNN
jgi:hypothetical protein